MKTKYSSHPDNMNNAVPNGSQRLLYTSYGHSTANIGLPPMYDFGEYLDNEEADKEEEADQLQKKNHEQFSNMNNNLLTIVKVPEFLSESAPQKYVSITPKPNYGRKLSKPTKVNNDQPHSDTKTTISARDYTTDQQDFKYSNVNPNPISVHEIRDQSHAGSQGYFRNSKNSDSRKSSFRLPETSLFSKFPIEDTYHDLFSDKPQSLTDRFLSSKSTKFDLSFGNEKHNKLPNFDYDNIEYFEPIVIDIDKEKSKSDFHAKLRYKYKNFDKDRSASEPLKLPDSLHETIDFLKKPKMHPPIIDMESEASEYKEKSILRKKEIT